jgi:hypothetical protein
MARVFKGCRRLCNRISLGGTTRESERTRTIVVLKTGGDFTENLARLAPIIKNKAFQEEKEWRLVSTRGINNERLSFRTGRSMLTPYFKFSLGSETTALPAPNHVHSTA